jgi:hypothetical protein
VTLTSDARTEVEAMRWILTRRAALCLAIGALTSIGLLRYYSYMTKTQAEEREKMAKMYGEAGKGGQPSGSNSNRNNQDDGPGSGSNGGGAAVGQGMGEAEEQLLVSESGGRGYVSLG